MKTAAQKFFAKVRAFLGDGDRRLIAGAFAYLSLPLAIFLFFWLRRPAAAVCLLLLLAGVFLALRHFSYKPLGYLNAKFASLALLGALIWVALSGIGGFGHQNFDFHARNAVFHDLTERSWPVTYDYTRDAEMRELVGENGLLVYYFVFWLPPAVLGKFAGWDWANGALFVWSVGGVFLAFLLIARYLGRPAWLIVPAFIFASGMDALGEIWLHIWQFGTLSADALAHTLWGSHHLESWPGFLLQYSSFTTQLFYVFNQAIPAWLATLLLLNAGERRSLVFIWALALPLAPLPALGLLPLVAFRLFAPLQGSLWRGLRTGLSLQNLLCAVPLALVAVAFFAATTGQHAHGILWQIVDLPEDWLWILAAFYLLEFLLLGMLLFGHTADRPLLVAALLSLGLMPLYAYGSSNDLAMRASIPALLVLFLLGLRSFLQATEGVAGRNGRVLRIALLVLFLLGSLTPLHEMRRSLADIAETGGFASIKDKWKTFAQVQDDEVVPYLENFVAGDPEDGLFYQLLLRRR